MGGEVKVLVIQLCPILCDSMDYSPPGSSVHGIFQARILEWTAIRGGRKTSGAMLLWGKNVSIVLRSPRFLSSALAHNKLCDLEQVTFIFLRLSSLAVK